MAYLEQAGKFQLKPVSWSRWEKAGEEIGLKFDFVDKDGLMVNGAFGWNRKDGSPNENIEIFSKALEENKSVLCEVEQGREKTSGTGHFYSVKWAVTKDTASTGNPSFSELKKYMDSRKTEKPAASEPAYPADSVPF